MGSIAAQAGDTISAPGAHNKLKTTLRLWFVDLDQCRPGRWGCSFSIKADGEIVDQGHSIHFVKHRPPDVVALGLLY